MKQAINDKVRGSIVHLYKTSRSERIINVLYFEVKDKSGNVKQLTVEFILDLTPPQVIFDGVEKEGEYFGPVDLSVRLEDPQDTIQSITVNGELYEGEVSEEDGEDVVHLSFSEVNEYQVEVMAYDEAGNEVTEEIPFSILEESVLSQVYTNKPLLVYTIVGVLVVIVAGVAVAIIRSRNTKEKLTEDKMNKEE
ncbi:hypothetical protein [Gracilibacillus saliphilus]|uniref:hypothetical protein n=1 Tax=Gracilibacillus saliphilus TaxID=543890 RepID=UPI0013D6042D|nr:hypothetical protein [Gracilibacillus saliphilus]